MDLAIQAINKTLILEHKIALLPLERTLYYDLTESVALSAAENPPRPVPFAFRAAAAGTVIITIAVTLTSGAPAITLLSGGQILKQQSFPAGGTAVTRLKTGCARGENMLALQVTGGAAASADATVCGAGLI